MQITVNHPAIAPVQPLMPFAPARQAAPGASLAAFLTGIGNATLGGGTRALDLLAPGRVLRAVPPLLSAAGVLLASIGNAHARALLPDDGDHASVASAALQGRIVPALARCVRAVDEPGLPADRVNAYCLERVAARLCQASDDAQCHATLERSREPYENLALQPPLTAADIAAAETGIQAHFRLSHAYSRAMHELGAELALMTDVSEGRDGRAVSARRLREQMRASDGWHAFKQKALDVSPRLNRAYKAAVDHLYRLQPQWLDGPGRDSMHALADERYPGALATSISGNQLRYLLRELADHLNHPGRAVAL